MNLNTLLNDYEKSRVEILSHRLLHSPIVLQINSNEKLDLRRMQNISRRLIFKVDHEELSSGRYLAQMSPGRIPVIQELFDINVECFLDKKLTKLVSNQDFDNSLLGFDTVHEPGIENTKTFFIRYTFSLKNTLDPLIPEKDHLDHYFESISMTEMYHKIFYRKVMEIEPFLKDRENMAEKTSARFLNERFKAVNLSAEAFETKTIIFSDFGYKHVECFYLFMRMFFQHFSDQKLQELMDSYNFLTLYPYLKIKDQYVFSYKNNYDDILEEKA